MGSFAFKWAVWSSTTIPPEEVSQADLRFPAIAVGTQIHLLILDSAPQPLHKDVVKAPLGVHDVRELNCPITDSHLIPKQYSEAFWVQGGSK
jgi:hypothetical protein